MTVAMVLAAGYGTRLRPLTDERPKALVPLGDRPVIAHQIERIREQLGEVPILVNTHHLANDLSSFVANYDHSVRIVEEREIRGTAGGLHAALEVLHDEPLFVVNSDVISDANYRDLLGIVAHNDIVLRIVPQPIGHGPVGVDERGCVARLRNESFGTEVSGGDYLGVAAIGAGAAQRLPAKGCLVADFMLPWLRTGSRIRAHVEACSWVDLGTPREYFRANMDWLRRRSMDSWLAPGTQVESTVELKSSILGEGSRVVGQGYLHRVIAWPGAAVRAPLDNAIVSSRGVIVRVGD